MTRLRADQLPAAVRQAYGLDAPKSRPRKSRAGVGDGQPCPGRCAGADGCGTPFEAFTRWERHRDVSGCGGRWEIDLEAER